MESNLRKAFAADPVHHDEHELPGNAAAAEFFFCVHVEDHGSTRMKSAGVCGPMADHDATAGDDLAIRCFSEESSVGPVYDGRAEVLLRGNLHDVERPGVPFTHVLIHRAAMVEDGANVVERGRANMNCGQ